MDFLSEPSLAVPHGQALEIASELLINHKFRGLFHNLQLLKARRENVNEDPAENNEAAQHEERQGLIATGPRVMVSLNGL